MSADDASITIKSGDTLSQRTVQYNREHGTNYTWQEVAEYNNLANPHLIHPGDVITFPAAPAQSAQPAPTVSAPSVPQPQAPKPAVSTPVYSAPAVSTGAVSSPSGGGEQTAAENTRSVRHGLIKVGFGVSEVVSGCFLAGTSPIGAVPGVLMILDGIGRIGLGFVDFAASLAEKSGRQTSINAEKVPSSIGGIIGAAIDKKNNKCFTDTGSIGPAQKTGEKLNSVITYASGTYDYVNTIKNSPEVMTTTKEVYDILKNETLHIYDTVDTVTSIVRKD